MRLLHRDVRELNTVVDGDSRPDIEFLRVFERSQHGDSMEAFLHMSSHVLIAILAGEVSASIFCFPAPVAQESVRCSLCLWAESCFTVTRVNF